MAGLKFSERETDEVLAYAGNRHALHSPEQQGKSLVPAMSSATKLALSWCWGRDVQHEVRRVRHLPGRQRPQRPSSQTQHARMAAPQSQGRGLRWPS